SGSGVHLQVLSPSVGVNTLYYHGLAATTTVAQLKEKIRDALPLRPAGDHQRLIHRGRLLARDTESLQEVFGEEAIRTGDLQTLHLVVRDVTDHDGRSQTPSGETPVRDQSPAPPNHPHAHHHHHHHHHQHPPPRVFARNGTPTIPIYPDRTPIPGPPTPAHQQQSRAAFMAQQAAALHRMQPQLAQLQQLQRNFLHQQQMERAAMGLHGVQDNRNPLQGQGQMDPLDIRQNGGEGIRRRMTPTEDHPGAPGAPSAHGAGPTSNPSRGPWTPAELQNLLRGADTAQATQTITNAMHRSASGASLASMASLANPNAPIQPIQPGVTTPLFPGGSRHASRAATPDPFGRSAPFVGVFSGPQPPLNPQQSQSQPEVYILSSPTGPRGLLINNSSDIYVTPAARAQNIQHSPFFPFAQRPLHHTLVPQPPFQYPQAPNPPAQPPNQPAAPAPQLLLPGPAPVPQPHLRQNAVAPMRHGHPNNPGAGALVAAAWPHVWLIIRLVVFVWWFTSGDASWSRWIAMITIAIIVFVVNTGILDGMVNQIWNPVRRHLEGLLPLGDVNPPQLRQPPPGFPPDPNDRDAPAIPAVRLDAPAQAPDPARVAARLVAQRRRDNTGWLLEQVRRLERAGLLFLASIAPGVAERHIAHLEAQERAAERQRREAEEAAARAAEAAAAATNE
ncbi:ubiquitin family protein, partial [Rhypophila decipiens]